jgi:parallel beta helix pectate lyase-like protein
MDLTVGNAHGDINGSTQAAIQAAIDRAAEMGGGTVTLLPGIYTAYDRIRMRTNTTLAGSGDDSVLCKADGWEVPLWEDGDWGNDWLTCNEAPPVLPGHGVHIVSKHDRGWNTTVATVLLVDGRRLKVDRHFEGNHMVCDNARVSGTHSIIDVENASQVVIRDLIIDGNASNNVPMDGCRGGAIHGLFADHVEIRNLTVRQFNGDAISFQRADDWTIENCVTENNTNFGLHPGSGSQRPVVRNCTSRGNGSCGIFVCWRVRHGVFEANTFENNGAAGVSIGHKDSDNVFRGNRIVGSGGAGILVRNEKVPMCPDRCTYEANVLQGNNNGDAQVVLRGEVRDLMFRDNTYDASAPRFEVGPDVGHIAREPE